MSNPAVITLVNNSNKKGRFKRFVIEDNIGEAIHLHIDNMRLDFTINEYLNFSSMIRFALEKLEIIPGFNLADFDEHFLKECTNYLSKLEKITIEEVELAQLKCIVHSSYGNNSNFIKLVPITQTPAFKYLEGSLEEFQEYEQFNYINVKNENRLLSTLDSIKKNGYPFGGKYLILFNGENIVRDGQHRAAILAHLHGVNYKVQIMRLHFTGNDHLIKIARENVLFFLRYLKNFSIAKLRKILNPLIYR